MFKASFLEWVNSHASVLGKVFGFILISVLGILISHYKAEPPTIDSAQHKPSSFVQAKAAVPTKQITVHLSGAVARQGVYSLDVGARLFDLIQLAGDFTPIAKVGTLNLARRLKDAERIHIPSHTVQTIATKPSRKTSGSDPNGRISINAATAKQFDSLPGIGPKLAARIIQHRQTEGDFKTIKEITHVKGIGNAQYKKIKARLRL